MALTDGPFFRITLSSGLLDWKVSFKFDWNIYSQGIGRVYSKTVVGCKENRRYEMGVKKIVYRDRRPRKKIFLDTHRVSKIFRQPHTVLLLLYTFLHP